MEVNMVETSRVEVHKLRKEGLRKGCQS